MEWFEVFADNMKLYQKRNREKEGERMKMGITELEEGMRKKRMKLRFRKYHMIFLMKVKK